MKEKLIIRNFGPIKDVELDLGRFNILIGEQATGKSTVAKVLAVCRYFSYIVGNKGVLRERNGVFYSQVTQDIPFIDGLESWGLNESLKSDTYIYYSCKHYEIVFDRVEVNNFSVVEIKPISKEFTNLLSDLKHFNPDQYDEKRNSEERLKMNLVSIPVANIPYNFYKNYVSEVMDNPFYFPTERGLQSVFSLGKASIPKIGDFLYDYFSKVDDILKGYSIETSIEPLNIVYLNENGTGKVKKSEDDKFYLLSNAASGYQSTIPIVLAIESYRLKNKKKTFIIEEPELNLFPKAQDKLMQYLVETTNNEGNSFLLTTHSPYTLTSLNNMMFARQVGQINEDKAATIIEKKYWIDYKDVSAYMMKPDGTAENIMDEESMQIKGERIDEVSGKFNKDFDDMLDLKYATVNEG